MLRRFLTFTTAVLPFLAAAVLLPTAATAAPPVDFSASVSVDKSYDESTAGPEATLPEARRAGFGRSVAVGEFEVFAGEPTSFRDPGMVRIFRRDVAGRWREAAAVMASDADVGDGFGRVLATEGATLVVGQPNADDRAGALYVFARRDATGGWEQTARITASVAAPQAGLGAALVVSGGYVFAGAPAYNEGAGGVFVYRILDNGSIVEESVITPPTSAEGGQRFGTSMSYANGILAVGAPGHSTGDGAVYVYKQAAGWQYQSLLTTDVQEGARMGMRVATDGDLIAASAAGVDNGNGAVVVFGRDGAAWQESGGLRTEGEGTRLMFGAALQISSKSIWVGEPGANEMAGAVHMFSMSADGWSRSGSLAHAAIDGRDQFGASIAVRDRVAIVSASGDAYGEGAAVVFEQHNSEWADAGMIYNVLPPVDPIVGNQIDCADGKAEDFDCENVDLVSFLPNKDIEMGRGVRLNDVWGWTDPESGREYALIGTMEETIFLDLGDPENPVYLGQLEKTEGSRGNTWRDIKTYNNHAFIVADGAGAHGMQVFDLTQLRDVQNPPVRFEATALYTGIASSHNIVINEDTGFAYAVGNSSGGETCGGALHMIDIKDPQNPQFAGCFNDSRTGNNGSGATHDAQCVIYHGPDTEHKGKEICIGSNGTAISVADVSNKENPTPISYRGYPTSAYVHQGWLTDDHRYFYQNDEGDELSGKVDRTRTMVWDLADLDDPILVTEFFGPTNSTDHNLYVDGDYMYQTNNASGLRIIDISDRENPTEFGFFDPTPYGKDVAGFNGTWSSYPYFKSGMIVVTSRREGVFILKKRKRDL